MIFDHHVLAFDVTGFVEAFAERGCTSRGGIERAAVDKPNHRHRRLLRTRRERPRRRCCTNERDEIASPHRLPGPGIRRLGRDYSRDLGLAKWDSAVSLRDSNPEPLMSALGQKQTLRSIRSPRSQAQPIYRARRGPALSRLENSTGG